MRGILGFEIKELSGGAKIGQQVNLSVPHEVFGGGWSARADVKTGDVSRCPTKSWIVYARSEWFFFKSRIDKEQGAGEIS
jgi:hypothetical protein